MQHIELYKIILESKVYHERYIKIHPEILKDGFKDVIEHDINKMSFNNLQEVYDYLLGNDLLKFKICEICGNENKFKNFRSGYTTGCCKNCMYKLIRKNANATYNKESYERNKLIYEKYNLLIDKIKYDYSLVNKDNLNEIYDFFVSDKYYIMFTQLKNNKQFKTKYDIEFNFTFNTRKELYDNLKGEQFCYICGKPAKFISFSEGYLLSCGNKECVYKAVSIRQQGENNTCHRMSEETKLRVASLVSAAIKKNIANGRFTPCVTNSWCHSKTPVKITRNNEEIIVNLRSSWEAFFQIKNPHLLYEKLRIPYKINGNFRSYILDFVDPINNIIYEIKPYALHDTKVNKLKFKAAEEWAKENNFKFIIIDNLWFIENYDTNLIKGQPSEDRLLRLLKQFLKNEN